MEDKISIENSLCVKEILKERNIKMKSLASEIGITPESLTRALQGNPQYSTLKKIADYLEIPVRDLFKEEYTKKTNNDIKGSIFSAGEIITFNNRFELEEFLLGREKAMINIPSFSREDIYKTEIKEFLNISIKENKSGAKMMRYGIDKVFTLSYDAESQKFSLTQCIGNGEIRFNLFAVKDYLNIEAYTTQEFNRLLEAIHSEIEL